MEQDTAIKDLGDRLCPWRMLCGAEYAEVYMHDQWQPARKWQTAFRISNEAGRGQNGEIPDNYETAAPNDKRYSKLVIRIRQCEGIT